MYNAQLRWQPIAILLVLALIWGANWAVVKLAAQELAPLFMAAARSAVAGICLYLWMRAKEIPIFPSRTILMHGIVTGFLFGLEFACLYVGLTLTLASRTYILLYSAPFFVALGAHLFLEADRLNRWKFCGLLLAFAGVVLLFLRDLGSLSMKSLAGDMLALVAGALWGATTVYIKKYLAHRTVPLQTLFYQVLFSTVPLFVMSAALEDPVFSDLSPMTWFSVFYQCIIVAFLSYLVWFELVHRYPVSLLHAFSFFTPVFGVIISGAVILGEVIKGNMILALVLVSTGMVLVNHNPGGSRRT